MTDSSSANQERRSSRRCVLCDITPCCAGVKTREFTQAAEAVTGLRHTRCPPRAHTWQSDVETAHRLIEDEFYEVERFSSRGDFLRKAGAYNLWFDVVRRNSGKEGKTPWEIIHEREPEIDAAVCTLPPIYLDELFMKKLDAKLLWGYDVIPHPFTGPGLIAFSGPRAARTCRGRGECLTTG